MNRTSPTSEVKNIHSWFQFKLGFDKSHDFFCQLFDSRLFIPCLGFSVKVAYQRFCKNEVKTRGKHAFERTMVMFMFLPSVMMVMHMSNMLIGGHFRSVDTSREKCTIQ